LAWEIDLNGLNANVLRAGRHREAVKRISRVKLGTSLFGKLISEGLRTWASSGRRERIS
jgi:hypothetical protein